MKKIYALLIILSFVIFLLAAPNNVYADTGPKPYVKIEFKNVTGTYYVTLLSKNESTGPYSANENHIDATDIDIILNSFKDDYHYLYYYQEVTEKNSTFAWTYYPPKDFKVLIYDKTHDLFYVQEQAEQTYGFASIYQCEIIDGGFVLTRKSNILPEILNLFMRMAITLVIELGLALLFRFRKKELLFMLITNVVTQLILNIILNIQVHNEGIQFILPITMFFLELLVIVIETITYIIGIPKIDLQLEIRRKNVGLIIGYTVLANIASAVLGFLILLKFPV